MEVRKVKSSEELDDLLIARDYHGWLDMTDDIYFGESEILSRSSLVKYLKCPAQYLLSEEESNPLIVGRAFHNKLLEPHLFEKNYILEPEFNKRTKQGKADYQEFLSNLNGRTPLDKKTYNQITEMVESVEWDPDFVDATNGSFMELTTIAEIDEILCKCKADIWNDETKTVVEVKTTSAESPDQFERDFWRFNYDIQCAFYFDVITKSTRSSINSYKIVGVQKKPPYQVYKFFVEASVFEIGRIRYKELLEQHKECLYNEIFPHAMETFQPLSAPNYLINKYL